MVQDLVQDPENTSPEELAAALKVAMAEPRLKNLLVSSQAHVTGVNVTIELPGETPFEVLEIAAAARELAAEFEAKYPDIKVYLTGIAMLNNAFAENSQRDMKTLVPIMFAAMVLVVVLTLRSIAGAGATLVLILLSTAAGMGIAGWLGIKNSKVKREWDPAGLSCWPPTP